MKYGRSLSLLFAVLVLPGAAIAETLALGSAYGNKDGCAYAASGESVGSDDFFLLTNEGVTTAATYCAFSKILEADGPSYRVVLTCEAEGESSTADFAANITYTSPDYTITFADDPDMTWGPLSKCR
jgi:hypothetical protein